MKKIFLSLSIIALAIGAQAQSVKFGVKAGLVGSNATEKETVGNVTNSVTLDTKIGFYAGGLMELSVSNQFAIQPELFFTTMGGKLTESGDEFKLDLNYINLPVLAKYKFTPAFSVYAGPQVGFLMTAKAKSGGESVDIKEVFKGVDFSGVLGVGYTLTSGVGFDARYQVGFANVAKNTGSTVKNNAFAVGIHYFFYK